MWILLRNEGVGGKEMAHGKSVPEKREGGVPALRANRRNTTSIEDSVRHECIFARELHNCPYVPEVCRFTDGVIDFRESDRLNLSP